jgi:uncharacterized Zn finger protein (UPF0148 family)
MEEGKQRIVVGTDLMRKGATMLREACPRCGGLQVKYQKRTLCMNCGDLSDAATMAETSTVDTLTSLKDLILVKVDQAAVLLRKETDPQRQSDLASLLLKYVELIGRLERPDSK